MTGVLKRGSRGAAVSAWQANLNALLPLALRLRVDGDFGPATEAATRAFQTAHGLTPDGIMGPLTSAAMAVRLESRDPFQRALAEVLKHEGGYVNHPADPGGATNQGITQRVYNAWRTSEGLPTRSVRAITSSEVATIYERQYWVPAQGYELPRGIDLCTFDGAVNSGVSRGAKWLQRAVGVEADGIVGLLTLEAARSQPIERTIHRMCDDRMAFLRRLRTWRTFGTGWSRRVAAVRATALAWAREAA